MTDSLGQPLTVGVVGTGYLGAVHAVCMAQLGHRVVAFDIDAFRIEAFQKGVAPFYEPGLEELLREQLATGHLRFTADERDLAPADVVFVCVGTPYVEGLGLDTRAVTESVLGIAAHLSPTALIVGKSTVPVGTAAAMRQALARRSGGPARIAWNPEFLREGHAIADTIAPSRLVYGLSPETAKEDQAVLDAVYAQVLATGVPRLVTDLATAELVKGAANAFLATKISFINTIADLCDASGGDVVDLAAAMGLDERIGPHFLAAGLGFGGGCLPKDIRGFSVRAEELGVPDAAGLLSVVDRINVTRRSRVVELATAALEGRVRGARVAILGFTFKPDSDDLRDSPALAVADELVSLGAHVALHDPRGKLPVDGACSSGAMMQVADVVDALDGADLLLHLTEWSEYRELDPEQAGKVMRRRRLIDGRNRLDLTRWREAGWECQGLGRGDFAPSMVTC